MMENEGQNPFLTDFSVSWAQLLSIPSPQCFNGAVWTVHMVAIEFIISLATSWVDVSDVEL